MGGICKENKKKEANKHEDNLRKVMKKNVAGKIDHSSIFLVIAKALELRFT